MATSLSKWKSQKSTTDQLKPVMDIKKPINDSEASNAVYLRDPRRTIQTEQTTEKAISDLTNVTKKAKQTDHMLNRR